MTWVDLLGRYSKWTYWKKGADRIFRHTVRKRTNHSQPVHQRVRKLPADKVARLVTEYQAGATVYELAAAFKINRKTASLHLKRAGVPMRQQGMTLEQVVEAAAMYESGWSLARLGEKFAVDPGTVHAALRQAGVHMRKPWERGRIG